MAYFQGLKNISPSNSITLESMIFPPSIFPDRWDMWATCNDVTPPLTSHNGWLIWLIIIDSQHSFRSPPYLQLGSYVRLETNKLKPLMEALVARQHSYKIRSHHATCGCLKIDTKSSGNVFPFETHPDSWTKIQLSSAKRNEPVEDY